MRVLGVWLVHPLIFMIVKSLVNNRVMAVTICTLVTFWTNSLFSGSIWWVYVFNYSYFCQCKCQSTMDGPCSPFVHGGIVGLPQTQLEAVFTQSPLCVAANASYLHASPLLMILWSVCMYVICTNGFSVWVPMGGYLGVYCTCTCSCGACASPPPPPPSVHNIIKYSCKHSRD